MDGLIAPLAGNPGKSTHTLWRAVILCQADSSMPIAGPHIEAFNNIIARIRELRDALQHHCWIIFLSHFTDGKTEAWRDSGLAKFTCGYSRIQIEVI